MLNELFDKVWISPNYATVFCTQEEKQDYLDCLARNRQMLIAMNIVVIQRTLNRKYSRKEIMDATPDQLRAMIN